MGVREIIGLINQMQSDGVIDGYAIGGAVGATFFLEPISTYDMDVFVHFKPESASSFVSLSPIFDYLKARGGVMEDEYIRIAGWPVQFLPTGNSLQDEALAQAVSMDVDGVSARVFSAEHLAAIALQTGRAKDKARVLQFLESGVLDSSRFQTIIKTHGLDPVWRAFQSQFLS